MKDVDDIYTSLPERPVSNPELRKKILDFLKENSDQWFKAKDIAQEVEWKESDRTMPSIRLACKELLHFNKEPIASCHAGFSYTTQPNVMKVFADNIQNRIEGMQRTLNDIMVVIGDLNSNNDQGLKGWLDDDGVSFTCRLCGKTRENLFKSNTEGYCVLCEQKIKEDKENEIK